MIRAKCMKARSIRAGSNPAGSRGAVIDYTGSVEGIQFMPLYNEQSGDLDRCYPCLTDSLRDFERYCYSAPYKV